MTDEERAEIAALREDLRKLKNVMELLLAAVSPKDSEFYDKTQMLEEQIRENEK